MPLFPRLHQRLRGAALALTAVGTLALAHAAVPQTQLRPLYWPESGLSKFSYQETETEFDNVPIVVGTLTGAGFTWVTNIANNWEPMISPPDRFAIAFRRKSGEPGLFGIAAFSREAFLPDLEAETWARYLAGLSARNGEVFSVLSDLYSVDTPSTAPQIMGAPTRELFFRRKDYPVGTTTELDLFLFQGNTLLVFTLTGPESVVRNQTEVFRNLINQFATKSAP